jgi:hypothetical protein
MCEQEIPPLVMGNITLADVELARRTKPIFNVRVRALLSEFSSSNLASGCAHDYEPAMASIYCLKI